jgi:hypothetical protein
MMVAARFSEAGYQVFVPLGDGTRIDMVAIGYEEILTIQCKTGRLIDKFVRFNTCSSGKTKKDYRGEVDFIGVFCVENNHVLLCDPALVPRTEARIYMGPDRPRKKGRLYSKDFVFENVVPIKG